MTQTNIDNLTAAINNLTATLNADSEKEIKVVDSIQKVIEAIKKRADSKDHQLRLLKNMLEILTAKEEAEGEKSLTQGTQPEISNSPASTPQYPQPPIYQPPITPPINQPPAYPPQQSVQPAPATPIPTTQATYTLEQLSIAATSLMDAGKKQDLMNLLNKYQIPAMTSLSKEQYALFAADLRALGAKI